LVKAVGGGNTNSMPKFLTIDDFDGEWDENNIIKLRN